MRGFHEDPALQSLFKHVSRFFCEWVLSRSIFYPILPFQLVISVLARVAMDHEKTAKDEGHLLLLSTISKLVQLVPVSAYSIFLVLARLESRTTRHSAPSSSAFDELGCWHPYSEQRVYLPQDKRRWKRDSFALWISSERASLMLHWNHSPSSLRKNISGVNARATHNRQKS